MSTHPSSSADLGPAHERMLVTSRAQLTRGLLDRERAIEVAAALTFIVAATFVSVAWEAPRSFDWPLAFALMGAYAIATRVEFRIATGWTDPSQLIFVPMLFLLPTNTVPFVVAGGLLLARLPDYRRGEVHADRSLLRTGDAWYSIWPVVILLSFGATSPEWDQWHIYLLALVAQFAIDGAMTTFRVSYGLGIPAKTVVGELARIDLIDALLSPLGLLTAFAAADEPWVSMLVVPLLAVFRIFAREREARIESALALSSAYRGTAHLLGEVLSSTDEYTGHHSRSVVVLAHQVGEALGLDEDRLRELEFGALLHDVGKIAIPNEIINKPGSLTDEEMDLMRTHTLAGEGMLDRIGGVLGDTGVVIRTHHERWDGTGYPDGLAGEEIPIAARVIAACDAFNAMTTDRSYRKAMSMAEAVTELRAGAGNQFDPRVVDALLEIIATWEAPEGAGKATAEAS